MPREGKCRSSTHFGMIQFKTSWDQETSQNLIGHNLTNRLTVRWEMFVSASPAFLAPFFVLNSKSHIKCWNGCSDALALLEAEVSLQPTSFWGLYKMFIVTPDPASDHPRTLFFRSLSCLPLTKVCQQALEHCEAMSNQREWPYFVTLLELGWLLKYSSLKLLENILKLSWPEI